MLTKLRIASLTALALLALGSAVAQAQSIYSRFLDRFANKDGKIIRAEIRDDYLRRTYDRMVDRYQLDPKKTYTREELQKILGLSATSTANSSGEPDGARRGPRGRSDSPGPASSARTAGGGGRIYRALVELPAEFREFDKDGDGQIGLYEWPRDRIAEFVALDKNGDGFLTVEELKKPVPREADKETKKETKPADRPASGSDTVP